MTKVRASILRHNTILDEASFVTNMVKQKQWPANAVLMVHQLCRFSTKIQIESVSFVLRRGQCLGIYGLSGSGKSDLVRMLSGGEIFDDGNFYLHKFDSNQGPLKQLEGISCAPQFNCYHEILTIEEMLILFAKIRRTEDSQIFSEVRRVGSIFQLTSKFKRPGRKLDEFTKRALTLAMAFVGQPRLVIIDEPTHKVHYHQ